MKTKKEKETRSVNEKFVNLLNRTFEKYKDISVLKSREEENCEPEEKDKRKTITTEKISTPIYDRLNVGGSSKPKSSEKSPGGKKRGYTVHKLYKSKQFTPDEDEVIIKIMKSAENNSTGILELTKLLNRPYRSIQHRIEKMATGSVQKTSKPFSLQEDFLIIDSALKSLKQCKSLEETELHDHEDLAKSLGRVQVNARWNTYLKNWLLQYYRKNLNLEIRPMLINVLAENFVSIQSIDWDWVRKIPEFSGYTSNGLKRLFTQKIHHRIPLLDTERNEITLNQLAEAAKDYKFSNLVNKVVLERQNKVIEYFEKNVEMENIKFKEKGYE